MDAVGDRSRSSARWWSAWTLREHGQCGCSRCRPTPAGPRLVPLDTALRSDGGRTATNEWARLQRMLPAFDRSKLDTRSGRVGPGGGVGLHEPLGADAEFDRFRRAGAPAVTSLGETVAAHVHRGQAGIDRRRQPVEQRLVERRVRRRRTERDRDRPPRPAGAADGGITRPVGGDRSARPRTCRCRAVRTRIDHGADRRRDPAPERRSRRLDARGRGRRARRQLGQATRQPCARH